MGDSTCIEWTDATWNPVVGCSVVSPGCTNCYAMKMAARIENIDAKQRIRDYVAHRYLDEMHPAGRDPSRSAMLEARTHYAGTTTWSRAGAVWTGKVALAPDSILLAPLRWRRPRRIFVNSMGDLFHESVPDEWIDKVFAVMALAPQHTFQLLTKRARRMREYLTRLDEEPAIETARRVAIAWPARAEVPADGITFPLSNVWLGVSAEDQARADERIPDLLAAPAAVRFVSAEPLLGPIDLRPWLSEDDGCEGCDDGEGLAYPRCSRIDVPRAEQCPRNRAVYATTEGPRDRDGCPEWVDHKRVTLDWVIAGGESGPHARPMHPDWARGLRDQCATAGVPFFFKQWGEWKNGSDFAPDAKVVLNDGRVCEPDRSSLLAVDRDDPVPPRRPTMMRRVGKRTAGRLLDGREHNDMPRAA